MAVILEDILVLLNNIAVELDGMLKDLCKSFPYSPGQTCTPEIEQPTTLIRNASILEDFVKEVEEEDGLTSRGEFSCRSQTLASQSSSSDADFYSLEGDPPEHAVEGGSSGSPPAVPPHPPAESIAVVTRASRGDFPILDRLIHTHPIWYLPNLGRAGAIHLLYNREEGNFLVRQSSQKDTMALSVRIGPRPNIEHYLLESTPEGVRLDTSLRCYTAIPVLISRYCETVDDLPVALTLPKVIMEAKNHQELTSLAMLGQDFWSSAISQRQRSGNVMKTVYHTSVLTYETTLMTSHDNEKLVAMETPLQNASPDNAGSAVPPQPITSTPLNVEATTATVNKLSDAVDGGDTAKKAPRSHGEKARSRRWITREASSKTQKGDAPAGRGAEEPSGSMNSGGGTPTYYHSKLTERISDYEDIWPSPTNKQAFFKPITNGFSAEQLLKQRCSADCSSLLNPAFQSDESGEDSSKSGSYPRGCKQTEHVERVETMTVERIVPQSLRKQQPQLFTFDLLGLEFGKPVAANPDLLKTTSHNVGAKIASAGDDSPAYAEPYDSLVGKIPPGKTVHVAPSVSQLRKPEASRQLFHPIMVPSAPPQPPPRTDSVPPAEVSFTAKRINDRRQSPSSGAQLTLQKIYEMENPAACRARPTSHDAPVCPTHGATASDVLPKSQSLCGLWTQAAAELSCAPRASSLPQQARSPERVVGRLGQLSGAGDASRPPPPPQQGRRDARQAVALSQYFESIFQPDMLEAPLPPPPARFPTPPACPAAADAVPELPPPTATHVTPLTMQNLERISAYDNVGGVAGYPMSYSSRRAVASSVGTHYCAPWDSDPWRVILGSGEGARGRGSDYGGDATSEDGGSSTYSASQATRALSEIATSFEWHSDDDDDDDRQVAPPVEAFDDLDVIIAQHRPQAFHAIQSDALCQNGTTSSRGTQTPDGSTGNSVKDVNCTSLDREDHKVAAANSQLSAFLDPPRVISLRNRHMNVAGSNVRDYLFNLASDDSTTFGATVDNFIKCTLDSQEEQPMVVMRNVRQFMSGIKNYLVYSGEEKLNNMIEQERSKLSSAEFMNIDAIIEGALHKCIIKPLKQHIYRLFLKEYENNGNLKLMSDNIRYAKTKTPRQLGIKAGVNPPEGMSLDVVRHFLTKMQKAYSPLKKLENLLSATSAIYQTVRGSSESEDSGSFATDDFLPVLIYVLAECDVVMAEVEADYMWGLLHPCLLAGEGGYYLTTLSSAAQLLKNLSSSMHANGLNPASLGNLQGFIKVIIPNEHDDSIVTNTLPLRTNMNTKDVCAMMAHKLHISNPHDYGLYIIIQGIEDKMEDTTTPQRLLSELATTAQECVFVYKRINAKFIWPVGFESGPV